MAELYCDHGIYPTPITGGTVPTESEEGNGKAIGAATMATRTITIDNYASIVTGQALTVAGVAFPANSGTNNFAAATTNNQTAINLAAAINASTTNATQPAGFVNSVVVRNLVNATVSGAVVTIYTRCSGSEWNSITETSTLAGVSITQWSGGADGAWGYFLNTSSIFPTAKAALTYGLLMSLPFLGAIAAGDLVHIRSAKTLAYSSSGNQTLTLLNIGSYDAPVTYLIDDGTVWPADGAYPVINFNLTKTVNSNFRITYGGSTNLIIKASEYPSNARGLSLNLLTSGGSDISLFASNGQMVWDGVKLESAAYAALGVNTNVTTHKPFRFINGVIASTQTNSAFINGANSNSTIDASNTKFIQSGAVSPHTGILSVPSNFNSYIALKACEFIGFVTGSRLSVANTTTGNAIVLTDCDLGEVTILGPSFVGFNLLTGTSFQGGRIHPTGLFSSTRFGRRPFVVDTPVGFIEWNDTLSFPTLNAVLDDGVTPWSIKAIPSTLATNTTKHFPLVLPAISKRNTLATGARTLTLELGVEKNIAVDKSWVWVEYTYEDSTGTIRVESTQASMGGALTSSTAAWSSLVDDGGTDRFTYSNSGVLYFNRYKLELTTAYSIKTGTEIAAVVHIAKYAADLNKMYFIDPDITVA